MRRGEITVGAHTLRILKQGSGFAGIVVGRHREVVSGATELEVETKLRALLAQDHPDFIGMEGARKRFLALFPAGFRDPNFIGDQKYGERAFKVAASQLVAELLPEMDCINAQGSGEAALRVFGATNLIADRFTKAKLSDTLKGPKAARFLALCAKFASGDVEEACSAIVRDFRGDGVATWPCLTYLPFLWRPRSHVFLKPTFTRAFAERIGHRFQNDYASTPNAMTYESLLDLVACLRAGLADLSPSDNIDLHSFMWTVMDYRDEDVGPASG